MSEIIDTIASTTQTFFRQFTVFLLKAEVPLGVQPALTNISKPPAVMAH